MGESDLARLIFNLAIRGRPCNMRAITQLIERAKSHPEALNATIRCVKKQKAKSTAQGDAFEHIDT